MTRVYQFCLFSALEHHGEASLGLLLIACARDHKFTPQGYGAGWDLIVPAGWGMPFWLSIVHAGARVAGVRERESLLLEMVLSSPGRMC